MSMEAEMRYLAVTSTNTRWVAAMAYALAMGRLHGCRYQVKAQKRELSWGWKACPYHPPVSEGERNGV